MTPTGPSPHLPDHCWGNLAKLPSSAELCFPCFAFTSLSKQLSRCSIPLKRCKLSFQGPYSKRALRGLFTVFDVVPAGQGGGQRGGQAPLCVSAAGQGFREATASPLRSNWGCWDKSRLLHRASSEAESVGAQPGVQDPRNDFLPLINADKWRGSECN